MRQENVRLQRLSLGRHPGRHQPAGQADGRLRPSKLGTSPTVERIAETRTKSGLPAQLQELQDLRPYQNQQNESQVSVQVLAGLITTKCVDSMNFYDKTLVIQLTNPEVRYEFDYEAKGKMFLLPIDTSGHATVILRESPLDNHF
jgi:hypothetical protein